MEDLLSRLLSSLGTGNMLWIGVALLAVYMLLKDSFPAIASIFKSFRDRFFSSTVEPVDPEPIDEMPIRIQVLEALDFAYTHFEMTDCIEGRRAIRLAMAHVYADHPHPPPAPVGPQPPPNDPPAPPPSFVHNMYRPSNSELRA